MRWRKYFKVLRINNFIKGGQTSHVDTRNSRKHKKKHIKVFFFPFVLYVWSFFKGSVPRQKYRIKSDTQISSLFLPPPPACDCVCGHKHGICWCLWGNGWAWDRRGHEWHTGINKSWMGCCAHQLQIFDTGKAVLLFSLSDLWIWSFTDI